MVRYTFELKLQNDPTAAERFTYSMDLNPSQEDNVNAFFSPEILESMRRALQNQSACRISPASLSKMIQVWKKDIREGYRLSSMTLNLESIAEEQVYAIQDEFDRTKPEILPLEALAIEPQVGALPPLIFS